MQLIKEKKTWEREKTDRKDGGKKRRGEEGRERRKEEEGRKGSVRERKGNKSNHLGCLTSSERISFVVKGIKLIEGGGGGVGGGGKLRIAWNEYKEANKRLDGMSQIIIERGRS